MSFFGKSLQRGLGNPLTQGGLALMAGQGVGGMQRGMQSGMSMMAHMDQQEQDAQKRQQFQSLFDGQLPGSISPDVAKLAQMAGPDRGIAMLAGAMPKPQQPLAPTADQREYMMAKQQGFGGSFMDYQGALRGAGATRVNVSNAGETAYDKAMGKHLAEQFVGAQETGVKAQRAIADLQVMNQALANPNVYLGTGGNSIQGIKKAASSLFGVPVDGVADGEVIQNVSNKIALSLKDNLPGPLSDSDRRFLQTLPPGLGNTPEGASRLVKLGIAQRRWEAERAQATQQFASQNGGRLTPEYFAAITKVDQKWAGSMGRLARELQSRSQKQQRPPSAGVPAIGSISDGYRFKGGNPAVQENWELAR